MIAPEVLSRAAEFRAAFQTAHPFKHVCVDEFFSRDWAEASLRDLPPFDREFARQEVDEFKLFNVIFSRAIIFETNEYSWHGFRKIQLPEDRRHISRKCLSIYLYTRDRPAEEIAGPHGTFYVQWPFPDRFRPGHVLAE